jgi:hypothetical protein
MPFRVIECLHHENSIGEQGNGPFLLVCTVDRLEDAKRIARERRTERPDDAGCWTEAWVERVK